jgi:hypothetical protein
MHGTLRSLPGHQIAEEVAEKHGVPVSYARGERWTRSENGRAKHQPSYLELCFRLRTELRWPWRKIATFCGRSNHTSAMYAYRRALAAGPGKKPRALISNAEWIPVGIEMFFQGKSIAHIGRAVGRSESSIRDRLYKVLAQHGDSSSSGWAE